MSAPALGFATDRPSAFVTHALGLIADFTGVHLVPGAHPLPDVYHGDDPARPCRLRVPLDGDDALFTILHRALTDAAHVDVPPAGWDAHDRLTRAAADPALGAPVVNHALQRFRARVEAIFGLALPRRRATVVLSHDVDDPVDRGAWPHALWTAAVALRHRRPRNALGILRRTARATPARQWLFDDIVALEARHGFRSSFYFAATAAFTPDGHPLDVRYDLRSPAFRKALRRLRAEGAEVGLHMGYAACTRPGQVAREVARLEAASAGPIFGGRHHYWHLGRPPWPMLHEHARAGLRYDSSLAFNERPGYRMGIAFPWRPFDPIGDRPVDCWQIPVMAMDGAWFYRPEVTVDDAVREFAAMLDVLKAAEGTAAIDWHVRTSAPGAPEVARYAAAYGEILALLAADPDVDARPANEALTAAIGP